MALITCPECKKEISDTAKTCPNCGYKIKKTEKWKKIGRNLLKSGIIIEVLLIIYSGVTESNRLQERAYYLTHGTYYSSNYYILAFFETFFENLGFIAIIIGVVLIIVNRKK